MSRPSTVISLVTLPLNELWLNFTLPWKKSRQGMFVEGMNRKGDIRTGVSALLQKQ